jgi:hypothetical protein
VGYGVAWHEGQLLGWINQAIGVFTALALLTLMVSRFVMWRRGKPDGRLAPVIPHKANEKNKPAFFAKTIYKGRGRLKQFKRNALRCEKTAQNFASIVSFVAGLCLIKFVHTA